MKTRYSNETTSAIVVTSLLVLATPGYADCDKCPKPDLIIYDFAVNVPEPENRTDGIGRGEWLDLFFAGPRAGTEISKDNQCVRMLSGAAFDQGKNELGGQMTVGVNHPFLPPAGDMKGRNYLFTGSVNGGPGSYSVNLSLEAACKRRVAHSASGSGTNSEELKDTAERLAGQEFRPLLETIREYERRVRATDPKVAIAANLSDTLKMEPSKREAKPFETVPVEFSLIDCDGEPLAGREIYLTPQGPGMRPSFNGSFDVATVTTDKSGKAKANFTVGGKTGVAIPRSQFLYVRPNGCDGVDVDEASINVDGSAALYELRFTYKQEKVRKGDLFEELPGGSKQNSVREHEDLGMRCLGIWRNSPDAIQEGYIELSGQPEAGCAVAGEYRYTQITNNRLFTSQESNSPDLSGSSFLHIGHQDTIIYGNPNPSGAVDLYFWYNEDELESSQFGINVPFDTQTHLNSDGLDRVSGGGRTIDTPHSDSQSDQSQTSFSGSVVNSKFERKRASIVVTGTDMSTEENIDGKTIFSSEIKAIITPVRELNESANDN